MPKKHNTTNTKKYGNKKQNKKIKIKIKQICFFGRFLEYSAGLDPMKIEHYMYFLCRLMLENSMGTLTVMCEIGNNNSNELIMNLLQAFNEAIQYIKTPYKAKLIVLGIIECINTLINNNNSNNNQNNNINLNINNQQILEFAIQITPFAMKTIQETELEFMDFDIANYKNDNNNTEFWTETDRRSQITSQDKAVSSFITEAFHLLTQNLSNITNINVNTLIVTHLFQNNTEVIFLISVFFSFWLCVFQ